MIDLPSSSLSTRRNANCECLLLRNRKYQFPFVLLCLFISTTKCLLCVVRCVQSGREKRRARAHTLQIAAIIDEFFPRRLVGHLSSTAAIVC